VSSRACVCAVLFACGRIAFDQQASSSVDDAFVGDGAPDVAVPCAGVDATGCIVIACAATPSCVLYCGGQITPLNWIDARADCQGRGGDLACLSSTALIDCVMEGRGASQGAWVGLEQQASSPTPGANWSWLCGPTVDPGAWAMGEPNDNNGTPGIEDGEEQCGALVVNGLNDGICGVNTGDWVCEFP
jgi:hypothetical protein